MPRGSKAYKTYKEEIIDIAKELCYPDEVIKKLEEATSEYECDRIMTSARRNSKARH